MIWTWLIGVAWAAPPWQLQASPTSDHHVDVVVSSADPALRVRASSPEGLGWGGVQATVESEPAWAIEQDGRTTIIVTDPLVALAEAWRQTQPMDRPMEVRSTPVEGLAAAMAAAANEAVAGEQIVIITARDPDPQDLGDTIPIHQFDRALLHAIVVTPPAFGDSFDPAPQLRRLVQRSHGMLIVAPDVESARQRLSALQAIRLTTARGTLRVCVDKGATAPRLQIDVDGESSDDQGIDLAGMTLRDCPPPPMVATPTQPRPAPTRWWTLLAAILGLGAAASAMAWVFVRRRPKPAPPDAPSPPTEVIGHLVQPPPVPNSADLPSLHIRKGAGLEGQIIALSAPRLAFGSDPSNEVCIELPGVAGRHVVIERFPGDIIMVSHRGGSAVVRIEEVEVAPSEKRQLRHGERLDLGPGLSLELDCPPSAPPAQESG